MICLGVESSCDDTSLALVKDGELLAQSSASQVDMHALFGGVVPEMASREHARLIGPLYDRLMREAGIVAGDIDTVAVARGPGLLGSLLVGVAFAKALALGAGASLIGINHLHAHLFAACLEEAITLPALGLLVSGGHTQLCRVEAPLAVICLGKTLDDAAGEAFDKAGKMLGLPYPAGAIMDALAERGRADPHLFPRPFLKSGTLDFSFSGLKTAMQTYLAAHPELGVQGIPADELLRHASGDGEKIAALADVCASYRLAVVETLIYKSRQALLIPGMQDISSIVVAGGVAANSLLREGMQKLAAENGLAFHVPSRSLCTDNGAMIAWLGWKLASLGYGHDLSLEAIPRGRSMPEDMLCLHSVGV